MTSHDPHSPGESLGSVFGRTVFLVCAAGFVLAVLCLAANLADWIGRAL
jgi:hypothetical protein